VRISAGAALAEPGDRPRDLLRRADAAMYAEKARHRALSAEARRFAGPRPLRSGAILEPVV
jgi:GGDEF domain-containing protein